MSLDWMIQARNLSSVSTCSRRKVGCVIVLDGALVAHGVNRTVAGQRCPTPHEPEECLTIHAEASAIAQAAWVGSTTLDAHAYVTCVPCLVCARLLIAAGIRKVFYADDYRNEDGLDLLRAAGVYVSRLVD